MEDLVGRRGLEEERDVRRRVPRRADAPAADESTVADGAYLEDSLYMLEVAVAELLVPRVRDQISIIYAVFTSHGLTVNMGAGKTECLLRVVGPGMKKVLREVHAKGGIDVHPPTVALRRS